jgi:hypothetical protein
MDRTTRPSARLTPARAVLALATTVVAAVLAGALASTTPPPCSAPV